MSEAMNRIITCRNVEDSVEIIFTERECAPFILAKADGIYDAKNNVSIMNNTLIDGATYQGTIANTRNIVLTLKDTDDFADNRDLIDVVFAEGKPVILTVFDEEHERSAECYTESITSTATPRTRHTTISLLCPDPFFYDAFTTNVWMSNMMDNFEFPHEFLQQGEEFSYINDDRIKEVINNTAENNVGLTITITSTGNVVNPSITKITTNERLAIGYTGKTFTLHAGESVVFTTTTGNKNVVYNHDGISEEINQYLTSDSVFYQLMRGSNVFGYDADTNPDYLTVRISYRFKYLRA